jgi:hypothetical protein
MEIKDNVSTIVEPFVGNGDLLKFFDNTKYNLECYDINDECIKKDKRFLKKDVFLFPPVYNNKFVLTNPPYLARNKSNNKVYFDKYDTNDLYKCFIKQILLDVCIGGIIIIPINFFCSIRKADICLRKKFLETYSVKRINIFEEQVFDDTTASVCVVQFERENANSTELAFSLSCYKFPENKKFEIILNKENNYTIGGEIYKLKQNPSITIERLTEKNKNDKGITDILVKCIDSKNSENIESKITKDHYIDNSLKQTARTFMSLIILPSINCDKQQLLVDKFNEFIKTQREKYDSLFLSNYREYKRKRISFDLVFKIFNYLYSEM